MQIASDASTVDAMIPNAGTPVLEIRPNCSGKSPSFAAASGISAQIIVHPTSAPRPEMITATAITLPAHVPPNIAFAASEKEAVEVASLDEGRIPNTAVKDSM